MHLEKRGFVIFLQWPTFWDFNDTRLLNYTPSGIRIYFPQLWRIFFQLGSSPIKQLLSLKIIMANKAKKLTKIPLQVCSNTEGSFECKKWEQSGPILCPRGYQMDSEDNQCVDINECVTDKNNCIEGSQRCVNTLGSYNCVRYTPCGTGYTFSTHTGRQEKITVFLILEQCDQMFVA